MYIVNSNLQNCDIRSVLALKNSVAVFLDHKKCWVLIETDKESMLYSLLSAKGHNLVCVHKFSKIAFTCNH